MEPLTVDFWNVGQGDASSIIRPDDSWDVIDVGPAQDSQLAQYLMQQRRVSIRNLILTHNDNDHIGALTAILEMVQVTIDNVFFLQDSHDPNIIPLKKILQKAKSVVRLEVPANGSCQLLDSLNANYRLVLKYPDFEANQKANIRRQSNDTSAIICLQYSDCQEAANEDSVNWRDIAVWAADNRISNVTAHCNSDVSLLVGSHHGAPQDISGKSFRENISRFHPKQAVLSFGRINGYQHPNGNYIKMLVEAGTEVKCLQCAKKCYPDERLEPVFSGDAIYGMYSPDSNACHGHIRMHAQADKLVDLLENEYRAAKLKISRRLCC